MINKFSLKATIDALKKPDIIQKCNGICLIKFPKPMSVFLGLSISDEDETKIKKICCKHDIKLYKMIKDESGYNLNYISI